MTVVHIVMFEFKDTATQEQILDACQRMLALKDKCLHPTSKKPYIRSASGGKDISPEGINGGYKHAFISEFESIEDRDHYLKADQAHLDFVKSLGPVIQSARVIDYEPGKF